MMYHPIRTAILSHGAETEKAEVRRSEEDLCDSNEILLRMACFQIPDVELVKILQGRETEVRLDVHRMLVVHQRQFLEEVGCAQSFQKGLA